MARAWPWLRRFLSYASVAALAGCVGLDGFVWSPDGRRAAYSAGAGRVYDATGKAVADLGPTAAVFGWSADGADLYFARVDPAAAEPELDRRWVGPVVATTLPAVTRPPANLPAYDGYTLCRWHDGKSEPVARLGRHAPTCVAPSPDGQWVVVTRLTTLSDRFTRPAEDRSTVDAVAVEVKSGRVFALADRSGTHVCFTGPHRVAFVARGPGSLPESGGGPLVEVTLDAAAGRLPLTTISGGRCVTEESLAAAPDGSVFFGREPADRPPQQIGGEDFSKTVLCRWDRKTSATAVLCSGFEYGFALSPDGRRVACYETSSAGSTSPQLALYDADGGNPQLLRPHAEITTIRLPPTWHGNDRLTLSADADDPAAGVRGDDVVDYRVTAAGTLAVDRVPSRDWPGADRPKRQDQGSVN